jgi:hypothetical protein
MLKRAGAHGEHRPPRSFMSGAASRALRMNQWQDTSMACANPAPCSIIDPRPSPPGIRCTSSSSSRSPRGDRRCSTCARPKGPSALMRVGCAAPGGAIVPQIRWTPTFRRCHAPTAGRRRRPAFSRHCALRGAVAPAGRHVRLDGWKARELGGIALASGLLRPEWLRDQPAAVRTRDWIERKALDELEVGNMVAARLIQLIETHAEGLTRETLQDLATNPKTRSFQVVPRAELELRTGDLYRNLGAWIGDPSDDAVQSEYEQWGRRRFRQGVPLSEIVYALLVVKHHLRRYIRDHGLVGASTDPVATGEFLPVHLHGVQELNHMVGEFFDRALYYLARGYEAEAQVAGGAEAR